MRSRLPAKAFLSFAYLGFSQTVSLLACSIFSNFKVYIGHRLTTLTSSWNSLPEFQPTEEKNNDDHVRPNEDKYSASLWGGLSGAHVY